MILPVTAALREHLDSPEYERAAADSELELRLEPISARNLRRQRRAAAPAAEEGAP